MISQKPTDFRSDRAGGGLALSDIFSGVISRFVFFVAALWMLAFWVFGFGLPLLAMIREGVRDLGLSQVFDPTVLGVARATLRQVFWSTLFSGGIGLILGLWVGRGSSRDLSPRLLSLFSIPVAIPTVVAGLGWLVWIGKSGILSRLGIHLDWAFRFEAVVLAHAFYNIPWVILAVAQARNMVPQSRLDVLKTLGASRWSIFLHGVWPQVRWAWATACAQVMGFCAVSFALVLTLGGGPPVQTLETEVYSRLRFGGVDWAGALACAFWELILTVIPWLIVVGLQARERLQVTQNGMVVEELDSSSRYSLRRILIGSLGVFFLLPYLGVFFFAQSAIFGVLSSPEVIQALRFSFSLAIWSSLLTLVTALAVLHIAFHPSVSSRVKVLINFLYAIPGGVSIIVLGFGVWLTYGRWIDPFAGSPAAIILLQVTLFFPLAMKPLWAVAAAQDVKATDAARTLGASPLRAWWEVEWPRWRGPVLVAVGTVFGAVLGEVGAVSLFASEKWVTLPSLISQAMLQYRFEEAQILAGILLFSNLVATLGSVELGNRLTRLRTK